MKDSTSTYPGGQGLPLQASGDSEGLLNKLQWKSSAGLLLLTCTQVTTGIECPVNIKY